MTKGSTKWWSINKREDERDEGKSGNNKYMKDSIGNTKEEEEKN